MDVPSVKVDIAPGELIDKITILAIKSERIEELKKLRHVNVELKVLTTIRDQVLPLSETLNNLTIKLKEVNERLWIIEDDIRSCEAAKDFGPNFIKLARSVYHENDERDSEQII